MWCAYWIIIVLSYFLNIHIYHSFPCVYKMWSIAGNQGIGTYWIPGSVYPGPRRVPGWVPPFNYPQCEGSRSWRWHSHTAGVWAWSQEIKVNTTIKFFPSCEFSIVYFVCWILLVIIVRYNFWNIVCRTKLLNSNRCSGIQFFV